MQFKRRINVGDSEIGGEKTFIIAEIGSNHNQDINLAYELIDAAVDSGADAVKFQSIKPETLYITDNLDKKDVELLEQIKLREEWYKDIRSYCNKRNILFFSAPTYLEAIDLLIENNVKLMKIASPQTYGFPKLIKKVGETNLPTIMSTGYCNYSEIERAVNLFKETGNNKLVLLHCISDYPTSPEDVNLNFIDTLSKMFGVIPGFSDHTLGYDITIGAVAKGAKVIEKHFTLSREMDGPDHHFALEPKEFKEMVSSIRNVEQALGETYKDELMAFEKKAREEVKMKICTQKEISEGEKITADKITYLRNKVDKGISTWKENEVLGKKTVNQIDKYKFLEYSDLC